MADKYVEVMTRAEQEAADQFDGEEFFDEFEEKEEVKEGNKFTSFLKKHWKKFVGGAIVAGSFIGGMVVGERIEAKRYYEDEEDYYLPDNSDYSDDNVEGFDPDDAAQIEDA